MSGYVLVDSVTVKTDAFSQLKQSDVRYTTSTLTFRNPSSDSVIYRVTQGDARTVVASDITVAGNGTGTANVTGLLPGTTYRFYLERNEHGDWIQQTSETSGIDFVVTTTKKTSVSTSVGSQAVIVEWDYQYDAEYTFTFGPTVYTNAEITKSGDIHRLIVSDLEEGSSYTGTLQVKEGTLHTLAVVNISTSVSATFQVDSIFASYADISWSADGMGASEEDGVADFRVLGKESSVSTFSEFVASTPDTINSATISDLKPGTQYDLKLQRLEVSGSWSDQASITLTTKTTSLNIQSVGSKSIEVDWTSLYEGAVYELQYGIPGQSPRTFGNSSTTANTAVIKELESGTEYTIELYVLEEGRLVGVATVALGSGVTTTTSTNYTLVGGVGIAAILVVLLVTMKLKK